MTDTPRPGPPVQSLKGFQRRTVDYAFERLFVAPDSSHRFLVADEVGLGKTLVARGVIAKVIDHLRDRVARIDIVYICSNSAIARQNVRRLNVGDDDTHHVTRLTLLPSAVQDLRQRQVNFIAFTPGTSFDLKSRGGWVEERVVLYWMLQHVWPDPSAGPKNVMQGWVSDADRFCRRLDRFREHESLDPGLRRAFKRVVERSIREERARGEVTLRQRYRDLCQRFGWTRTHVPAVDRDDQMRFLGDTRALLAATCIEALEPDLVILDEFQRFRDLLQPNDGAGELARHLFEYSDGTSAVRILLLSATPYKMYTLQHEQAEDDHYKDFLKTCEFLSGGPTHSESLRTALQAYRGELFRLGQGAAPERLAQLKREIESFLRRYMCRTERLAAGDIADGMLREAPSPQLELLAEDVRAFAKLATVAETIDQPGVVEFWKSAPYLLSFMDQYKLKQEVLDAVTQPAGTVRDLLKASAELFVDWPAFRNYRRLDPQNAGLRWLEQWLEETSAWQLLWLPPSLPYWTLEGALSTAQRYGITKLLLFSSWTVVPKAVASLVSYEVERRIFRQLDENPRNTAADRRRRRPRLRFARTEGRLTGMPVLGLLYPSVALATLVEPLREPSDTAETLVTVQTRAEAWLRPHVEVLVARYGHAIGREDETWYWAAPILLDLEVAEDSTREWFKRPELAAAWSHGSEHEEADDRWSDHVDHARRLVTGELGLGAPPSDLLAVVARLALAGPGVAALRALTRGPDHGRLCQALPVRDAAASVAWAFRSLFNQPEAMALVRARRPDRPYWQLILDYAAEGCLQAVLDEYAHLARDLEGLIDASREDAARDVASAIVEALSLRTSTAQVDDLDLDAQTRSELVTRRRIRNHFALRFASQEAEDGAAGARIERVRASFNSPFWPFILTTTAVGQEGLDFHAYSHALVHWNLPSNPVDLEQREGRVNRYKGHAVRKNVASRYGREVLHEARNDPWTRLFAMAQEEDGAQGDGLVPYWLYAGPAAIERHAPALPLSRDTLQLERLKRSLAVYRMVFGQPRQDDLMAYLLDHLGGARLRKLTPMLQIDLRPGPMPSNRSGN